ncbi:MAG: 1-acyl-sn-glycerol-3-phosphate acyltransferase [Ruminococcus sp.]|nr:1-acyl-sn-glycerol-3-phosphate acyltransferase [Ruminococcus sp.]
MNKRKKAKLFDLKKFPLDMARLFIILPLSLGFRVKKYYKDGTKYRKILRGGMLIASNHIHLTDALLVASAFWYRRMYYLTAKVVMNNKIKDFLMSHAGAIKIDRYSFDIEAINKSVDVLSKGHTLVIFPEGGVKDTNEVQSVKSGAVLMALRSEVPILPMYIEKRKHWYNFTKVYIGDPIYPRDMVKSKFPSTQDIDNISIALMDAMNECVHHQ